ncbi:protein kinase domain-containing protein [Streptomyces sp. NPDC002073]
MTEVPSGERVVAGRYRLLGPLGQGGMGTVWRARDEVLGREVAVKEVRAPAGLDAPEIRRLYARLEREAWAAARISHRGVVTVYDVATEDGRPWIVMELIRGLSLAEALAAEGPVPPQRAAHIGAQVLTALRAAHASGVLHRDVKPANVLLANDGRVVLSDFGIARLEGSAALTMTGEVVGSPEFLAPERALGRDPGPESDLWSLGVLLYAAVEGVSPFRRDSALNTLRAAVEEEPPPTRLAGPLAPVIEGLLRKDPAGRLPAAEAARMLRIVGAGGAVRAVDGPSAGASGPAPGAVTEPAGPGPYPPGARTGVPYARTVSGAAVAQPGPADPARPTRAGLVLTVGTLALLLALAALVWLLVKDRGTADDRGDAGGRTGTAAGPAPATTGADDTGPGAGGTAGTAASTVSASPPGGAHEQSVRIRLLTDRAYYTGGCPPVPERAPRFRGLVEVGRLPARVEYRWAARDGGVPATAWEALVLGAGTERTRTVGYTVTAYRAGGVLRDAVRLEVRLPAAADSPWAEFTVTCEEAPPTDGASPSGTPSPSASSSPPGHGTGAAPATGSAAGTAGARAVGLEPWGLRPPR